VGAFGTRYLNACSSSFKRVTGTTCVSASTSTDRRPDCKHNEDDNWPLLWGIPEIVYSACRSTKSHLESSNDSVGNQAT